MYELLFSSHQPKAKNLNKHLCNVMFPPIQRKLTDKMVDDLRHEHQQAITEIAFFQGLLHNGWGVFFLR